jgi:hypothetical protein
VTLATKTLSYGSETWAVRTEERGSRNLFHTRKAAGYTLSDLRKNEILRESYKFIYNMQEIEKNTVFSVSLELSFEILFG